MLPRLRRAPTLGPHLQCRLADSALPDVVVISSGSWYPAEKRPVEQLQADLADLAAAAAEADAAARQASTACCWVLRSGCKACMHCGS